MRYSLTDEEIRRPAQLVQENRNGYWFFKTVLFGLSDPDRATAVSAVTVTDRASLSVESEGGTQSPFGPRFAPLQQFGTFAEALGIRCGALYGSAS